MRRPLVIYDIATAPFWISLYIYMRKIWFSFLSLYAGVKTLSPHSGIMNLATVYVLFHDNPYLVEWSPPPLGRVSAWPRLPCCPARSWGRHHALHHTQQHPATPQIYNVDLKESTLHPAITSFMGSGQGLRAGRSGGRGLASELNLNISVSEKEYFHICSEGGVLSCRLCPFKNHGVIFSIDAKKFFGFYIYS
jgi:hypothetical protein